MFSFRVFIVSISAAVSTNSRSYLDQEWLAFRRVKNAWKIVFVGDNCLGGRKEETKPERNEGITDTKSDNCFSTCEKTSNGSRPSLDGRQQARLNVLMITLNCLFSLVLFFSLCSVFWNFNFTHFRLACLVCVLRVISLSRLAIERRKTETTSRRKSKKWAKKEEKLPTMIWWLSS